MKGAERLPRGLPRGAQFSAAKSVQFSMAVDNRLARLVPDESDADPSRNPTDLAPSLVVGEVHHPVEPRETAHLPSLVIPERRPYTGVVIFGAVGSCKTNEHPRNYSSSDCQNQLVSEGAARCGSF